MSRVTATELKNNVSDILNRVIFTGSETIVERYGKPVVKIMPFSERNRKRRLDLKRALDESFGSLPDFPDVTRERKSSRSFFKLAGILTDAEARRMEKMVREGRRDGSRHKKYLAKW